MAQNRRVKATKSHIRSAYLGLLSEKQSKKISVSEVCSIAGINRSTFYAHYKDIDALYHEMEQDLFSHIPTLETEGSPNHLLRNKDLLEEFFQYVYDNSEVLRVFLTGRMKDDFEKALVDIVFAKYRPNFEDSSDMESRYAFLFCVAGVISAMSDWVRNDFPVAPGEFAGMIHEMCRKAVVRD